MILEIFKNKIREKIQIFFDANNIQIDLSEPTERLGSIENPKFVQHGDLAFNFAPYAKKLGKNPAELAKNCAEFIEPDEYFLKIQAVGVYLNFFVNRISFAKQVLETEINLHKPENEKLKIMVEFLSANPNKPLHIGQARNVCIGDSIAKIFRAQGYTTHSVNYGDDSGVNVGYNIVGHLYYNYPLESKNTNQKFDHYCGDIYTQMRQKDEETEFKKLLSETLLKIEKGTDKKISELQYEYTRKCTIEQFKSCWKMNAYFDLINRETDILHLHFFENALEILKNKSYVKFVDKNSLSTEQYEQYKEAEGCWIIDISSLIEFDSEEKKYQILVKSDGVATYVGKDIAYAMWKHGVSKQDFFYKKLIKQDNERDIISTTSKPDENIYTAQNFGNYDYSFAVIDNRQSFAQKVVKGALKLLGKEGYNHLSYGIVSITPKSLQEFGYTLTDEEKTKKVLGFSSRKGRFITIDETLDLLQKKVYEATKLRNPDKEESWLQNTANKIAIGAFRFFLIKTDITKDIVFDIDEILSLEGETGAYVLYTYARISSILSKSNFTDQSFTYDFDIQDNELGLEKMIDEFKDIVKNPFINTVPTDIAKYLYNICQLFNTYYANTKIITDDENLTKYRLKLIKKVQETLKVAMHLIGMKEVEKM